jgi:two-component system, cell cycle sensor histidine kinase DivJ
VRWENVSLLESVYDYIDGLVHASVRGDTLLAARHRLFIAPRMLGSFCALAAFPIYLAVRGMPSGVELLLFSWLIIPILTAVFLTRTGRYEAAHVLSSLSLTGLIAIVAAVSGGTSSYAAIWLVLVPIEAAASGSRRVVAIAAGLAFATISLLLLDPLAIVPKVVPDSGSLMALSIILAAVYASGLALGAASLMRASFGLLNDKEDRYRLLARNMTEVITRHTHNGTTLSVSPGARSLLGVNADELLGHGLFDRIHVADRPAYLTALAETAAVGEDRSTEFRVRCESGDPDHRVRFLWIDMRCRQFDGAAASVPSAGAREVVAVLRDITERKTREAAQETALEEARAASERANAAKGRFITTMTHELPTPLNVIIGFSEMLRNESKMPLDTNRRREYAKLINESGTHLLSVVNGILDMSRLDNGEFEIRPEPLALGVLMHDCCELMALSAIEAGLELSVSVLPEFLEVVADKRAMKRILINLLSNALKSTDRGGRVSVRAQTEGAMVLIIVEDNGAGIGEDDLSRLGGRFCQGQSSVGRHHDGTGLGLAIVKALATLHGGELKICSRVGQGTQVLVRLPLDCQQAQRARPNLGRLQISARMPAEVRSGQSNLAVRKRA